MARQPDRVQFAQLGHGPDAVDGDIAGPWGGGKFCDQVPGQVGRPGSVAGQADDAEHLQVQQPPDSIVVAADRHQLGPRRRTIRIELVSAVQFIQSDPPAGVVPGALPRTREIDRVGEHDRDRGGGHIYTQKRGQRLPGGGDRCGEPPQPLVDLDDHVAGRAAGVHQGLLHVHVLSRRRRDCPSRAARTELDGATAAQQQPQRPGQQRACPGQARQQPARGLQLVVLRRRDGWIRGRGRLSLHTIGRWCADLRRCGRRGRRSGLDSRGRGGRRRIRCRRAIGRLLRGRCLVSGRCGVVVRGRLVVLGCRKVQDPSGLDVIGIAQVPAVGLLDARGCLEDLVPAARVPQVFACQLGQGIPTLHDDRCRLVSPVRLVGRGSPAGNAQGPADVDLIGIRQAPATGLLNLLRGFVDLVPAATVAQVLSGDLR